MLESLLLSIKVVLPLVLFIGIGYILRYRKIISDVTVKELNNVVFKVLLSTMLFYNIYTSNLKQNIDLKLLLYAILSIGIVIIILCIIIPRIIKDRSIVPVMIQGIYRSNFVLFGLQVTVSICGEQNLGMTTVLISVIIPIYNIISVILFETFRSSKVDIKKLLKGIVTNPLVIATLTGVVIVMKGIRFNEVINDSLKSISQIATPLSLIVLGGTITVSGIRKYWGYSLIASFCRLIVIPCIFLLIGIKLGFRGSDIVALMVMYASPTAVSSFPMALSMGGNSELAGQIVAITTILSIFTIFIWTYVLSIFNLI